MTELKRSLGFWALLAYGVGDILGAGIYSLVGKVAGAADAASWLSFGVAMGVAALTALSYSELAGRYPRSGGAAVYCREAFQTEWPAFLVGWLVLCSGMVSMATVSRGFAGYLESFLPRLPYPLVAAGFLFLLAAINFRGIRESSGANILCTLVELSGLFLVIFVCLGFVFQVGDLFITSGAEVARPVPLPALFQGAALAFFALIGFEDMANVAEEAHRPERDLPRAMLAAVAIAGGLYMLIGYLAVRVVPPAELAASPAPLLAVVRRAAPNVPPRLFSAVALFAVSNTALLNFVMGSRLLYGMAKEGLLPAALGSVHARRQTPHVAIGVIFLAVVALTLSGGITFLAGTTSSLILAVFILVHASLLVIKRRTGDGPAPFRVPVFVPLLGIFTSIGLLTYMPSGSLKGALLLAGLGGLLFPARRLRRGRK